MHVDLFYVMWIQKCWEIFIDLGECPPCSKFTWTEKFCVRSPKWEDWLKLNTKASHLINISKYHDWSCVSEGLKFAHQCAFPSNEWDISFYLSSSLRGVRGNFVGFRGSLQKLFIPFFNATAYQDCARILIHWLLSFIAMTSWNVILLACSCV